MTKVMKFGSRLRAVKKSRSNFHWFLIPGGPGIESDYMASMALQIPLDVNILTFDLPRAEDYLTAPQWPNVVSSWREDLLEALRGQQNIVLVGHSFGGMLALSIAEVEKYCAAAIFLDSSPSKDWEKHSSMAVTKIDAAEANKAEAQFAKNPSNDSFKNLCIEWAAFYFLPEFITQGKRLLSQTNYNYFPYQACEEFFRDYRSQWSHWNFPTLCLAGDTDLITPLCLFEKDLSFTEKPNVELVEIKNAGHFPWVENPKDFTEAILKFHKKLAKD